MYKKSLLRQRQSLRSGEEANDLWESIQSRSNIRVEDHSIIDESMVVIMGYST